MYAEECHPPSQSWHPLPPWPKLGLSECELMRKQNQECLKEDIPFQLGGMRKEGNKRRQNSSPLLPLSPFPETKRAQLSQFELGSFVCAPANCVFKVCVEKRNRGAAYCKLWSCLRNAEEEEGESLVGLCVWEGVGVDGLLSHSSLRGPNLLSAPRQETLKY